MQEMIAQGTHNASRGRGKGLLWKVSVKKHTPRLMDIQSASANVLKRLAHPCSSEKGISREPRHLALTFLPLLQPLLSTVHISYFVNLVKY